MIGRLSYSFFWYLNAALAKVSGLSLITVTKWLQPILWSLVFPLLLYAIAKKLGMQIRAALFTVWLSFLPFALQSAASFTLPVNLGFLVWLAGVWLILDRLQNPGKKQFVRLLIFGILSIFNYTLFFILFWLGLIIAEIFLIQSRSLASLSPSFEEGVDDSSRWRTGKSTMLCLTPDDSSAPPGGAPPLVKRRTITSLAILLIVIFCIPLLEIFAGYSSFTTIHWLVQFKQLVGNFTAWYIASGPRPHDITTGNIIFNQIPSYAFVGNFFTDWRWWLPVFMVGFWAAVVYGIVVCWKKRNGQIVGVETHCNASLQWTSILTVGLSGGYIISRYFLAGEQVLSRRLDIVLAFFFIIITAVTINRLMIRFSNIQYLISSILIIIFSFAITASFSLGPDTNTVSLPEYNAMKQVWSQEKAGANHCVIADTYPLLALEAISGKEIIGGGFPIDQYFAQPELAELFAAAKSQRSFPAQALAATGTDQCWLVAPFETLAGEPAAVFGNIGVWLYNNK